MSSPVAGVSLTSNNTAFETTPATQATNSNGVVTFQNLNYPANTTGTAELIVDASGVDSARSGTVQISAGANPRFLQFTSVPNSVTAGATFSVTAQVFNSDNTPVSTPVSGVSLVSNGVAFETNPANQDTDANGLVTFSNLKYPISASGTANLQVDASGVSAASSDGITVNPPPPQIMFLQQPGNSVAGQVIDPPITVEVRDGQGNLTDTSVTLSFGTNPTSATLGGTLTQDSVNGVATFADITVSAVGSGFTLTADTAITTPLTSDSFDVVPTTARVFGISLGNPGVLNVYDSTANGAATPVRQVTGANANLNFVRQLLLNGNELFVASEGNSSVRIFPTSATGDATPTRIISGGNTTLNSPTGLAIVGNELFVSDSNVNDIDVFPVTTNGDIAPSRTIVGANTLLNQPGQMATDGTNVFVANTQGNDVLVFAANASGDVAPIRRISGFTSTISLPVGVAISGNELFVTSLGNDRVLVFPLTANGDVAPTRAIAGGDTTIDAPTGISVFNNEIFTANATTNRITVHNSTDNGDVAPQRVITNGPNFIPHGVAAGNAP